MKNGIQNSISSAPQYIDQVFESLLLAISLGEFKPGERIRQNELAERLGVSRQPVSHALQLLKHQGLVRDAGKQGVEIAPVDPAHIMGLYQVRIPLEGLAVSLAAARLQKNELPAAQIKAFEQVLRKGQQACKAQASLAELVQADFNFHCALYQLSGNPVIEQMMQNQWSHLMRAMMSVLADPGVPVRAWQEHADIAAAILAGDAGKAQACITSHLHRAGTEWCERLVS
ncbi:GntR family transcriptional regulator [Comamonas sp. J-3]|jgi:DNA-binding GntR family transcriptional regulator|uniref:GntR family transcriptional regulator n=1 Tax=Comamonas trifloxystrobinivorans TaxID=3350256 RepID=UPI0037296DFB